MSDIHVFQGETPLHKAARKSHKPVVSALPSKGGDPNIANKDRNTPLYSAASVGKEPVASVLLSYGADPNVANNDGSTPLHVAAIFGYEPVVLALLSKGGDPNISDETGDTPLHLAARQGHEPVVSALLSNGGDPHIANKEGCTPIHRAADKGHEPVVSVLIAHGADANVTDINGCTAIDYLSDSLHETKLHSAARCGSEPAVERFLKEGFVINMKNSKGYTPLHLAAINGSRNVTVKLLKEGALLLETDPEGNNAMELAQKYNNQSVLKLYKSILESGLPKELLYLKTQDSNTFTSNLRSGFYLSFSGKIMSVGHEAVGKTAITTKLRGLKPSPKRKSTEGLDLHIYKAAVDMETKKWICKELDIEDVAFRDLVSQPKILATTLENINEENLDEDESTENVERETTQSVDHGYGASCETIDDRRETQLSRIGKQKGNSILRWIKLKLGLEKASMSTVEEIIEEAVRRGKKGLVDSLLAPIIMMDFGGQTAFYSTHQAFLSYRGVYIVVINGSKGFDEELDTEMFIPGLHGKPTSRKFMLFWVGSIESFSTGTSDSFPKILVVCTHKDKVPKNEADQKVNAIFTEIKKMYEGTTTMKHLVLGTKYF